MIETFDTVSAFDTLKPDWQRLEASPKMRIFQTWLWCRSAWTEVLAKEKGNRLWLLKWSQDGRDDLVICPFYIDGSGCLRYLLDTDTDVCDIVHSDVPLNRHWVYREIADAILKEPRIKSVWLQKMAGDSEALNYLSAFLPGRLVYRDNGFSFIKIGEAGDFLASQPHHKSEGRKHLKKLLRQSMAYDFAVLSHAAGDSFPEEDIRRLMSEMIGKGMRKAAFISNDLLRHIRVVYEAGFCEIPVLKKDGVIGTMEFRLLKGDYTLDWIFLSPYPSTGTEINVRYCFERAKEKTGVVDFGVGIYEYKILTTRPELRITCSLRYAKGWCGMFNAFAGMNVRLLKDYIKAIRRG